MKFHIDSNNQPAPCSATQRACPLGGEHFESLKDAHVFVAQQELAGQYGRHANAMGKQEAYDLTKQLLVENGLGHVAVRFANTTKSLGHCRFKNVGTPWEPRLVPSEIALSIKWLDASDRSVAEDTIRHEVAHAIAGHDADHGPEWQAVALRLGGSAAPTHNGNADDRRGVVKPWVSLCPQCGFRFSDTRAPSSVYSCGRCSNGDGWAVSRVYVLLKNGVEVAPEDVGGQYSRKWASIKVRYADEFRQIEEAKQEALAEQPDSSGFLSMPNGDCHFYGAWYGERRKREAKPLDPAMIEALKLKYLKKFKMLFDESGLSIPELLQMAGRGELD